MSNITEILIILIFVIVGIMLIFTGWSIIKYNNRIQQVKGKIIEKIPISSTGSNCLVLSDGTNICNYIVSYSINGSSKTAVVGSNSNYGDSKEIDIYVNTEDNTLSTQPPLFSKTSGWFYIVTGVLNFIFIFYLTKVYCQKNQIMSKFDYPITEMSMLNNISC